MLKYIKQSRISAAQKLNHQQNGNIFNHSHEIW